jgi:hypothetical protein
MDLFSPSTRLHDTLDSQGRLRHRHQLLQELNLDVSTEELLSAERGFTFADLYEMLESEDSIVWLTPHATVARRGGTAEHAWSQLDESCGFCCSVDDEDLIAFAFSPEHLLELSDVVLRLLAVSVVHEVDIYNNWSNTDILINPPTLAYLMEQCRSLKVLLLMNLRSDEDHIRVLGAYSRPDLEIVLRCCTITSAGASALVEVLGRNQGPTKLEWCTIDNFVLADGLRENSRLDCWRLRFSRNLEVCHRQVLAIAGALRENKGIVNLDLTLPAINMSDETWDEVCDSLKAHPTIEILDLRTMDILALAPAALNSRIQALVNMLKVNMSIDTIHLDSQYSQHELFRGSVIPYLESNRFRPRLLAIQRTRPIPYRAKVLGRALLAVRTDPNRFWMLLSGNAEVAFPPTTATIAAAANLPDTSTTVAATSTTNAVAASVMSDLTTNATSSLATATVAATDAATSATTPSNASASNAFAHTVAVAAASVATPPTGQKRKAGPNYTRD